MKGPLGIQHEWGFILVKSQLEKNIPLPQEKKKKIITTLESSENALKIFTESRTRGKKNPPCLDNGII